MLLSICAAGQGVLQRQHRKRSPADDDACQDLAVLRRSSSYNADSASLNTSRLAAAQHRPKLELLHARLAKFELLAAQSLCRRLELELTPPLASTDVHPEYLTDAMEIITDLEQQWEFTDNQNSKQQSDLLIVDVVFSNEFDRSFRIPSALSRLSGEFPWAVGAPGCGAGGHRVMLEAEHDAYVVC
ncbi:hypothetical protein EJB05_18710, partial [Eragrostis curvula]